MRRMKALAATLGVAVLMAVVAACGSAAEPTSLSDEKPTPAPPTAGGTTPTDSNPPTTPIVSHGGPVKDYVSLVDTLRAAGATVDPAGPESFTDYFAPQGQLLTVNGERVLTFEFGSAEEADAAAAGVSADGSHIVGPIMADGTAVSTAVDWMVPAHFYKAGKLIVLYVACDVDVINLLQETMGSQFAGGAGLSRCPEQAPPNTMEIRQALNAVEGSEVTVSGFLLADRDGNTRLCSGLLESDPPQCGGDRIGLLGFDASSVPNSKTPQRPSEIQTARWTNSNITVTGIKMIGGLSEVRLSNEAPATQQDPGAPATTESNPPTTPIVSHGGPVKDLLSLVDNLRQAGAAIDPAGNVSQPFFAPEGQVLTVNGEDVQAFEFASADEADAVAETVSADGSSIGTSHVRWIAPPHFYKAGRLIVLYIGCDSDAINIFQETMGPHFAGDWDLSQCP